MPAQKPFEDREDRDCFDSDADSIDDDIQRSFVADAQQDLEEELTFLKQQMEETQGDA